MSYLKFCHNEPPPHQPQRANVIAILFETASFETKPTSSEPLVRSFLKCVVTELVPAEKEVMNRMELGALQRQSALKESSVPTKENMALRELETGHTCHAIRASPAVHRYAM